MEPETDKSKSAGTPVQAFRAGGGGGGWVRVMRWTQERPELDQKGEEEEEAAENLHPAESCQEAVLAQSWERVWQPGGGGWIPAGQPVLPRLPRAAEEETWGGGCKDRQKRVSHYSPK